MKSFHPLKAVLLFTFLLLPMMLKAQETTFTFSSSALTSGHNVNPAVYVLDGVQLTVTASSGDLLTSNGSGNWPGDEAVFPQSPVNDITITFDQPVELKSFEIYEGLDIVGQIANQTQFTSSIELLIGNSREHLEPWLEFPNSEGKYMFTYTNTTKIDKIFIRAAAVGNQNPVGQAQYIIDNLIIASVNAAPTATDVSVSGDPSLGATVTANYTYNDEDGDDEIGTTFQWSRTLIGGDGTYIDIAGATSITYIPTIDDLAYDIRVTVTPGDQYAFGEPVSSQAVAATCAAGFTCAKQDVSVCDSDSYTTPGGLVITEGGTYQDEVGTVKTFYNVTFDRTNLTPDVFIDAIIAESGSVTYEANTSATGVLSFDKSADRWVNLNALQDDLNATSRSVFMWVKSETDVKSNDQVLLGINTASGGNVSFFFIDNSGENLELYDGGTTRSASYDMGDDEWHYVGYTYDASTNETIVYVDGLENTRFTNNQITTSDDQYSLGQEFDNSSDSDHFSGDLAEVSIWNEVLTGAEMRTAMRAQIDNAHPKFSNLVGYYSVFGDCDDDTSVLKDHSGKGNDGVMQNFAVDFKNVQSINGFNAIDWYDNFSWKKDGTEASTNITFTTDVATGNYEFVATRSFIQSTDSWAMTLNSNAAMVDDIADKTLCTTDEAMYGITDFNKVNYLDFEETESNYIDVTSVVDDLAGTSRSVFMWVNKESNVASGDKDMLFSIQQDNVIDPLTSFYIGSSEKLTINDGSSSQVASTALVNDTWYYVGYTYDATSFETKIYLNGAVEKTFTSEMPAVAGLVASMGQRFGNNGNGPTDFLDGKLAEITVWNSTLTEEQIAAIMGKAPTHDATNLIAAYGTLQNIADARIFDLTANNNDGRASHSTILVTTEEATITGYDASNNYVYSWTKEGSEFETDAAAGIVSDEGITNYSIAYGTPLFQKTDDFALNYTNLIPTQSVNQTGVLDGSVTFSVDDVSGATYQWFEKRIGFNTIDPGDPGFEDAGQFSQIYMDGGSHIYIGSTTGGLYISRDGGGSWMNITSSTPGFGDTGNGVNDVKVVDEVIYVAIDKGLSISKDAGTSWTYINSIDNPGFATPTSGTINSVAAYGGNIYAVGSGVINISNDNGDSWSTTKAGRTDEALLSDNFRFVHADGENVYVSIRGLLRVINGTNQVLAGDLIVSKDAGSSWMNISQNQNGFPNSRSGRSVYATGNTIYAGTSEGLVISTDGGTNWSNVHNKPGFYLPGEDVYDIYVDGDNVYVASRNAVNTSGNGGQTWSVVEESKNTSPRSVFGQGDAVSFANTLKFNFSSESKKVTDNSDNTASDQIQGATSHQLVINNLSQDLNDVSYTVVVTKDGCTQTSVTATLSIIDGPVIISTSPVDDGTAVGIDANIEITFNETMSKGTGNILLLDASDDTTVETIDVTDASVSINGAVVTINPVSDLAHGKTYYIQIAATVFKNGSDQTFGGISDKETLNFSTENAPDTTAPILVSSTPLDEVTGFVDTKITLTFSENVIKGTGRIRLFDAADDTEIVGAGVNSSRVSIVDNVVTFDLINQLPTDKDLYLIIPRGAFKDANNNLFAGVLSKEILNFSSLGALSITASSPANGATEFAGTTMTFTFDRNVSAVTGRISVHDAADDTEITSSGVNGTRVSIVDNVVSFDLVKALPVEKKVYVKIQSGGFKDVNDILFAGITDKTSLRISTPTIPELDSTFPLDETTDFGGTELTFTFDRTMFSGTGRIAVYDAADDSEITAAGVGSTRVTIVDNVVTFDLIKALPVDKEVYINIPPSAFKDINNNNFPGITDKTTLRISALTRPTLVSTLPADEAINFGGTTFTLTFDRDMFKGTGRITVFDASNDSQVTGAGVGSSRVTIVDNVVTFNLIKALPLDTEVYVNIPASAFKDVNDNVFPGILNKTTLSFSGATAPKLLSSLPADNATGFEGTTITLTFDRNVFVDLGRISLKDAADDTEEVGSGVSGPRISITDNVVTFDLRRVLPADKAFYLNIPARAFKDADDNYFSGVLDKTTLSFNTNTVAPPEAASNTATGLRVNESIEVKVYPNPASNRVTVDLSNFKGKEVAIKLFNTNGRPIFTKEAHTGNSLQIDVTGFTNGMYIIQLTDGIRLVNKKVMVIK